MRLKEKFSRANFEKYILPVLILFAAANLLTVIMCMISEGTFLRAFMMPSLWAYFVNTITVFAPMLILFFLVRRTWIAFLPFGIIFSVFNYADYIKVTIRGETILPCDFTILSEAADTVEMLTLEINSGVILAVLLLAAITVGLFFFDRNAKRRDMLLAIKYSWIASLVSLVLTVIAVMSTFLNPTFLKSTNLTPYQWKQLNTRNNNGFFVNFLANIPYIIPEKPSDYNNDTLQATYAEMISGLSGESEAGNEQTPNIIIVMSESFVDGDKFKFLNFAKELCPTLHDITENKTGGTHFTPQFGGGTSNVEFELLTGYSLRFLPASSTPYQQHIKTETNSYVSFLRDTLGYSTVAIHSYGAAFWNRDDVYPLIGFEKFIAEENILNPVRMRTYVSDETTAEQIISAYEANKSTGKPFFNFTVTMQNHGSYAIDDYDPNALVYATNGSGILSDKVFGMIQTYATGTAFADDMLLQLKNYFSSIDEPTILMFFGDHLGSFGNKDNSYYASGYTSNPYATLEGYYDLHTPPFVIWDNYTDIAAAPSTSMSTYYLIPYMTDIYSLPQPRYFRYLLEQLEVIKGTANSYYLDSNGEMLENEYMTQEESKWLKTQQLLQYDAMFGKRYVTSQLWEKYTAQ